MVLEGQGDNYLINIRATHEITNILVPANDGNPARPPLLISPLR